MNPAPPVTRQRSFIRNPFTTEPQRKQRTQRVKDLLLSSSYPRTVLLSVFSVSSVALW
jgi:hypothetical protein